MPSLRCIPLSAEEEEEEEEEELTAPARIPVRNLESLIFAHTDQEFTRRLQESLRQLSLWSAFALKTLIPCFQR